MSTTAEELNRIAYGNKMSLTEWKAHFTTRYNNLNIKEYKDVKRLVNIDGREYKDIKTLIVMESKYYYMKYGSGSGSSGSNSEMSIELDSYGLDDNEIQDIVHKYVINSPIFEHNVRMTKRPINWSSGRIEQRQAITYNTNFKKSSELFNDLRRIANEKFAKQAIKKLNVYHIDGETFRYESIKQETVGDITESPLFQFYLFNDNNICHLQLNMNPIQG